VADHSKIEWTDATWNPITGCTPVSSGCANCYAARFAATRGKHLPSRAGLAERTTGGFAFNGQVRFNDECLYQPLHWRRPRRVFVCAHADLFHEAVPDKWIDRIFAIMALCPQHTFQVLTKRAERMREYLSGLDTPEGHMRFGFKSDGSGLRILTRRHPTPRWPADLRLRQFPEVTP